MLNDGIDRRTFQPELEGRPGAVDATRVASYLWQPLLQSGQGASALAQRLEDLLRRAGGNLAVVWNLLPERSDNAGQGFVEVPNRRMEVLDCRRYTFSLLDVSTHSLDGSESGDGHGAGDGTDADDIHLVLAPSLLWGGVGMSVRGTDDVTLTHPAVGCWAGCRTRQVRERIEGSLGFSQMLSAWYCR